MILLCLALAVLVGGALLALSFRRSPRWVAVLGAGAAVSASVLGLVAAVPAALGAAPTDLRAAWSVPYGSFHVGLDPLSGLFLIPLFVLAAVGAIYGVGYLRSEPRRSRAAAWFFYDVLVASMLLVLVARDGVLFLAAWELMALSSFFLVTQDVVTPRGESKAVREAGIVYLVATHLGTAFLLVMFLLLGGTAGSLDFDTFGIGAGLVPAGLLFVLALVGFGAKAGFVPLHVWLPEAHPVAPSHVSALMSGVMIKTGIYGLLRVLTFLGAPAAWWGWTLIAVGLASGLLGVLFALAQRDLKRLLAYSSVENVGIVALGLGVGLVGTHAGLPTVAALGFAGALLHVVNHALFKGLLFLAAGSVAHGTGTLDLEALGGLQKRMPWTASLFLVGSVAIAGLPPLNGFVSELAIYLGALRGATAGMAPLAAAVIAGLALIGGLSVAAFTKAYGIAFLGEPRTEQAREAHEAGPHMRVAMVVLALGCVAVAFFAWAAVPLLAPLLTTLGAPDAAAALGEVSATLRTVSLAGAILTIVLGLVAGLRYALLRKRVVTAAPTWGCGYAAPTPRMQYTAASFAEPLTRLFAPVLRTRTQLDPPQGPFPEGAALTTRTTDQARLLLYAPAYRVVLAVAARLRPFQAGRVQLYVFYIALTLFVLLAAALGR